MAKDPEGGLDISGDDNREPVKFYEELEDDRVHSLEDMLAALRPFERSDLFNRQNLPDYSLDEYLNHEENLHWGNPRYEFDLQDKDYNVQLSFRYSPWMNVNENTLLKGRTTFDQDISRAENAIGDNASEVNEFVDFVYDDNELADISIPTNTDPNTQGMIGVLELAVGRTISYLE